MKHFQASRDCGNGKRLIKQLKADRGNNSIDSNGTALGLKAFSSLILPIIEANEDNRQKCLFLLASYLPR